MKLFSRIYGEGKPLIIIHGLFGMSDNWINLGKRFGKYYNVHMIDLRNHGQSPHSDEFNYDVMREDLLKYIQDQNIQKPILLGHSLGGKVAMKFSFTHPNKIEKLIVADISPRRYNTDFVQNILQTIYNIPLGKFAKREEIDNLLSERYKEKEMRQFLLKNLYRKENKQFAWRFNIEVLLDKVCNIQEADFIKGVCDIPTYFIRGRNSNYISDADELIINNHFDNFSITTIDRAGHWLHADNPERFYKEVLKCCLK